MLPWRPQNFGPTRHLPRLPASDSRSLHRIRRADAKALLLSACICSGTNHSRVPHAWLARHCAVPIAAPVSPRALRSLSLSFLRGYPCMACRARRVVRFTLKASPFSGWHACFDVQSRAGQPEAWTVSSSCPRMGPHPRISLSLFGVVAMIWLLCPLCR